MTHKFVVRKIILPKNVQNLGIEKTEPTLENTIKSVLSYCNALPTLCKINEVNEEYHNKYELVFYFDVDKYRFFDVESPISLFYGRKWGDEVSVIQMYYARFLRSMVTLSKAEDLLRLMNIEIEYLPSFVETIYEKIKGETSGW